MLQTAQFLLGWIVGLAGGVVAAIALAGLLRPPLAKTWLDRTILVEVGAAVAAAVVGAITLASGAHPADPLHFLYALLAIAILPVGRAWGTDAPRPGVMLLAGLALAGVTLRLFQTG